VSTAESPSPASPDQRSAWEQPAVKGRWRAVVFAPKGDGIRTRLGSDPWRLLLCFVLFAIVLFAYRHDAKAQNWLVHLTVPPPRGVTWLLTILAVAGTFGVTGLLIATSLFSRRRDVLIDVIGAGAIALVGISVFRWLFGVTAGVDLSSSYPGVDTGIPVPSLTIAVAMALAARPYLARPFQRLCYLAFGLGALCTMFDARGLPLSILASLLIGWGAAVTMRLVTGTPVGLPGADDVSAMLSELGVPSASVTALVKQTWGAARYDAVGVDGSSLRVSVYGRDTRDAELAVSIGRAIAYRDEGQSLLVTRLQQAEHEAYVTLRAKVALNGAGPDLVAAGRAGPSRDGVVVTRRPVGRPVRTLLEEPDSVSDATVAALFDAVGALAQESLSHGSIDPDHVVVRDDGTVVIDDFLHGTSAASPQRAARDLASAITIGALLVGPERAVHEALESVGQQGLASALAYFQAAALPPALAATVKPHPELLEQLRTQGASAIDVTPPELAKLTRVSVATLIFAIGTLIGGWALIGVLLNVASSFSTIRGANLLWVLAVAVLAVLCYPSSALSCEGSIPTELPFVRLVVLEVSNTFSGLAVGTVAVLGARVRFFQKQGLDATSAVSSGVLVSTASWIVKGALFLIAVPFALSSFNFHSGTTGSNGHGSAITLVLVVICGIGIALGVVLFVPRIRAVAKRKLAPKAAEIRAHLRELSTHPLKLVEVFGGMVACQLLVAYALGASLHAFGASLSIAQLLIVLTLGSVLGGISPVPGGMGVVEAGMIIGLTAVGIPQDIAVSAVFVQRLFTAYLPPIAGWFALAWLRKSELL